MDRIVLDCKEKGCQRSVRWVVFFPDGKAFRHSCSNHLGKVIRSVYWGCDEAQPVTLQHI